MDPPYGAFVERITANPIHGVRGIDDDLPLVQKGCGFVDETLLGILDRKSVV